MIDALGACPGAPDPGGRPAGAHGRRHPLEPWLGSVVLPAALIMGDGVVDRMFGRTDGMFGLWFPGIGKAVMLADPGLVRDVFRAPGGVIDSAEANRVQEPVIGPQGLGRLDGQGHRRLREIMAPAIRHRVSARLRAATEELAQSVADRCPAGTPFALRPRLHAALMDAILAVTLSVDPARGDAWRKPLRELFRRADSYEITVRYALRHAGGMALWPSYRRAKEACDRLIYDEISRRRREGEGDDLLGVLMRARDEHGARLTDQVLRDQVMSMIAGARTTTATGLAWAFERVVRHPGALRRLSAESDEGTSDVYATAVAYEALRVRPPVAFFGRVVRLPFELGGRVLEPGTTIIVHLRSLHHDPGLYPDPAAFRPERWLGRRPGGYGWMPFGGGSHTCLGDRLAVMQMKAFLRVFTRSLELSPAEPADEQIRWKAVSNTPGSDCRVIARPR
ncbi:cytochrome P450 [Nonomuraea fuscirosea]|uniref:cytochrome P450 n=1 Tax=Nonomuraea fuscirosea TaxID=1291556 RepID=UPI0037A43126